MPPLFRISDEHTQCRTVIIPNRSICLVLGSIQLTITGAALWQHLHSIYYYHEILYCQFNDSATITFVNTSIGIGNDTTDSIIIEQPEELSIFVQSDLIIFDVGLFYELWGLPTCIAIELDGGYGRCLWCICHAIALSSFLTVAVFFKLPPLFTLWPMLYQQSAYGIGLMILTLAATPRVLPTMVSGNYGPKLVFAILVYTAGITLNFYLLYIYWHYYWYVESMHKARTRGKQQQQQQNQSMLVRTRLKSHNTDTTLALDGNADKMAGSDVSQHQALAADRDRCETAANNGEVIEMQQIRATGVT